MKEATAKVRFLRITPRKVRSVAGVIRGLQVAEAEAQLMIQARRAATPLLKLLRSAMANAVGLELDRDKLVIRSLRVDPGPMRRGYLPRARGRATPLQKKMSHVTIVLGEREGKEPRFLIPRIDRKEERKQSAEALARRTKDSGKTREKRPRQTGTGTKVVRRTTGSE